MTAWIFQGFFAIFLIMIVVIFQEELRQLFERIAVWSLARKRIPTLGSSTSDVLVRTVADLAKEHVGALIVIRGNDPLERHITGGIPLDGKVSAPLLKSIFDPHSPGHDGAVMVDQDSIARFAAHLPLSKDLRQLANVGTRHSAALGLAELTDALCIVVSEERGTISVARDGKLREVQNIQELGAVLESFLQTKFPSSTQNNIALPLFRENWIAKAIAIALAIGFWYIFVPGAKTVDVSYTVPVSIENLPPDLQVEDIEPPVVNATFRGPRRAFYLFNSSKIKVAIDVSMAELGRRTFTITEKNIQYPKELTLQDVSPSTLRLSVRKVPNANETNRG
jgi:diadenylate cyclase